MWFSRLPSLSLERDRGAAFDFIFGHETRQLHLERRRRSDFVNAVVTLEVLFSSHALSLPKNGKKMRNLHDMQDGVWAARIAYSAMSGVSRLWITSRSMKKYARKWIWQVNAHRQSRYAGRILQFPWRHASAAIKRSFQLQFRFERVAHTFLHNL